MGVDFDAKLIVGWSIDFDECKLPAKFVKEVFGVTREPKIFAESYLW
jgi:hypothetical protein